MQNTKTKLERLQEKGLRADFKDKRSTYEDLLNKAKLPTLYNQRLQKIATLMFTVITASAPHTFQIFSIYKAPNIASGTQNFVIPRLNIVKYGKHSTKYLGPTLWRRLPRGTRNANTLSHLKKLVRLLGLSKLN